MMLLFSLVIAAYLGNCESVVSQALDVTLVVFSGVPDPQWQIKPNDPNYQNIRELFNIAGNQSLTYLHEQMPAQLGYKGFLVRESNQGSASLILGLKTKELQKKLLQSIPPNKIPKILMDKISLVIDEGRVLPVDKNTVDKDIEKSITKRAAPNYAGASTIWNNNYAITRNNCYNYANDKVTNTFAQPGKGSGQEFAVITNDEIKAAARRDGLLKVNPHPNLNDPIPTVPKNGPRHLVALVVDPGVDFHWYRLDSNSRWSHKPGETRITAKDGARNPINDPRVAANEPGGPNYQFVCFMTTDKNTVRIS